MSITLGVVVYILQYSLQDLSGIVQQLRCIYLVFKL